MNHDQVIQVRGQVFCRVPVTATLRRADASAVPVELVQASNKVTEQSQSITSIVGPMALLALRAIGWAVYLG